MKHIVSMAWLAEHFSRQDVVVVDCRFTLGKGGEGRSFYEQDHIPGAFYLDLEQDLSSPVMEHGGRHPLPDLGALSIKLGEIGVTAGVKVVAYDDQGGAMASRLWWLLRFLGHEQVFVMDEGYKAWKAAGYPVTAEKPLPRPATFSPKVQRHMLIALQELKEKLGSPGVVLLDSRESKRYLGLEEPIDKVAGHIPGARNFFWKGSLDESGRWLPAEAQQERFAELYPDQELIVYCGSGVTACPNVLALSEAGFPKVRLYAGSWSDWISYEENPIATGEE
ncbi:3-mercaptopyruvate sulfurtransferase [Gordoniibacillus kamchatkensis]|uniref:3-mercaptopyruvate sulfurtransferase n=1 Tax=Gordoniibacillus kamchatkensis TaxID=1590651 RepID=A0ABR5AFC7_9BACL|nr:sulfurtransferase [Paenibacillus sp. VKM B-2647]KIL39707.1 3-mercaptopyruvate sulfurtransferase [Paenibacillus sp. VKM B-2647]